MNPLIDAANLENLLDRVYDARIQTYAGFVPAPGEPQGFDDWGEPLTKNGSYREDPEEEGDRHAGKLALAQATEKLRWAMFQIGRAAVLDPSYGPKTQINEGTFYQLFGELDSRLLKEQAATEGFQKGMDSVVRV